MEDGPLWKYKNENERKTLLQDLNVVLEYGENGIKEALIRYGFKPGTKIIDIKRFTGLTEHGFTITTFIVQHESGGEIRAVSININLSKMEFIVTGNQYLSSGKERYYYLKKEEKIIKKNSKPN